MKKIIFGILFAALAMAFAADKLTLEVCNPNFCYLQKLENVKSWEWKTDFTGRKFVRVYFYDKKLLDIKGDNVTIKVKKDKR